MNIRAVDVSVSRTDREWRIQLAEALRWSSCSCFYDAREGVPFVLVCRRCKILHEHDAALAKDRSHD